VYSNGAHIFPERVYTGFHSSLALVFTLTRMTDLNLMLGLQLHYKLRKESVMYFVKYELYFIHVICQFCVCTVANFDEVGEVRF
jgi:hypothetical protein